MVKRKQTITEILLGDSLGELATQLDDGHGDARLMVISIGANGVRVGCAADISKAEALGALYGDRHCNLRG